jgi:putative glutamine amidotransferase
MKPRIAIPTPTSGDHEYNQRSWQNYADAVAAAGGEPVRVPLELTAPALRRMAQECAGVCLPGSPADVDTARYATERDPATSDADPAREAADFALLDHAYRTGKPVLAICFGTQALNVWRGGSLVQDVTPLPVNHAAGRAVAVAHAAVIAPESGLGGLLRENEATRAEAPADDAGFLRLPINTSHHQAVAEPGDGLRIVARCPDDGVVEAIEADPNDAGEGERPGWVVGVQWHPERSTAISAASRALFAKLVSEAALHVSTPPIAPSAAR